MNEIVYKLVATLGNTDGNSRLPHSFCSQYEYGHVMHLAECKGFGMLPHSAAEVAKNDS